MNDARLTKKMGMCNSSEKLRKMMLKTLEIARYYGNNEFVASIIKDFSSTLEI